MLCVPPPSAGYTVVTKLLQGELQGTLQRCTMSFPLPRIGDCRTVRQVIDAHAAHGTRYGPLELGASWNTLGKLVRQQSEKHVLRGAPATAWRGSCVYVT